MPRRMDYAILSPAAGSNAARLEDTVQKDLGKRHKGGRRDAYRIQGRGGNRGSRWWPLLRCWHPCSGYFEILANFGFRLGAEVLTG